MCQEYVPKTISVKKQTTGPTKPRKTTWRLPLPLVVAALPFLPTAMYVNRGYTVWFHLVSTIYFLSRSPFVRQVAILQGVGICLGWYSAIIYDAIVEGTFCHTLYRNMPNRSNYLLDLDDGGYEMLDITFQSLAHKLLAHTLDFIGHPGLLWLLIASHKASGGSFADLASWNVIASAWYLSRSWSLFHSYVNQGRFALWYFGHDIYNLASLDCYLVAYVAEAVCFAGVASYRLHKDFEGRLPLRESRKGGALFEMAHYYATPKKCGVEDFPQLIHSESAASALSAM